MGKYFITITGGKEKGSSFIVTVQAPAVAFTKTDKANSLSEAIKKAKEFVKEL